MIIQTKFLICVTLITSICCGSLWPITTMTPVTIMTLYLAIDLF